MTSPDLETSPEQNPLHYTPTTISKLPTSSFPTPDHGTVTWQTLFSTPATSTSATSSTTPVTPTTLCAGIASCPPKTGTLSLHRHTQAEIYHVISGEGIVTIDGEEIVVGKGSVVFIPGDAEHGVRNLGGEELRWLYVFPGASFGDVVYRFS